MVMNENLIKNITQPENLLQYTLKKKIQTMHMLTFFPVSKEVRHIVREINYDVETNYWTEFEDLLM